MYYNTTFVISMLLFVFESIHAGRRIFLGEDVAVGDVPYIASWVEFKVNQKKIYGFWHICTCSVLTPTWALSAAHCMDKPPLWTETFVQYNARHTSTMLHVNASKVLEAIPHPNFDFDMPSSEDFMNTRLTNYDICLLRTTRIDIEQFAVLSAVDYKTLIGHEVYVFGYGTTNVSSEVDVALKLQKPLQVYKGMISRCPEYYEQLALMVICITSPCGSLAMICGGDSGGPVIHTSGILGVNSFSENDCETAKDMRAIHKHSLVKATSSTITPLSSFVDWISRILQSTSKA